MLIKLSALLLWFLLSCFFAAIYSLYTVWCIYALLWNIVKLIILLPFRDVIVIFISISFILLDVLAITIIVPYTIFSMALLLYFSAISFAVSMNLLFFCSERLFCSIFEILRTLFCILTLFRFFNNYLNSEQLATISKNSNNHSLYR